MLQPAGRDDGPGPRLIRVVVVQRPGGLRQALADMDLGRWVHAAHQLGRGASAAGAWRVHIDQPRVLGDGVEGRVDASHARGVARDVHARAAPVRGVLAAVVPGLPKVVRRRQEGMREGRVGHQAVVAALRLTRLQPAEVSTL
jgi:hypothetical protein